MIRYGFVGTFNFAVIYTVYCLIIYIGFNYSVASLGSLVLGIMLSFVTQGRYVFMSRLSGRFPKFLSVWAALYFVNIGIISVILSFGANAYQAGIVAAVPTIGLGFLLQWFYVFR